MYPSSIVFVYYNDLEYGHKFFTEVLRLEEVMDQGFAKVYKISETSFAGIVQLKESIEYKGNTLLSLNTLNVHEEHKRVQELDVYSLTDIQTIESIPLDSFFFKDKEGHDFEIQQFTSVENLKLFNVK